MWRKKGPLETCSLFKHTFLNSEKYKKKQTLKTFKSMFYLHLVALFALDCRFWVQEFSAVKMQENFIVFRMETVLSAFS